MSAGTAPAVAACPACRRIVTVRTAPSGTRRFGRHCADERGGPSCPGTGREIPR
jgi:hypothetical protein